MGQCQGHVMVCSRGDEQGGFSFGEDGGGWVCVLFNDLKESCGSSECFEGFGGEGKTFGKF